MKTVIVTGASRGLGLAIAKALLSSKVNVIAVVRDKSSLAELSGQYTDTLAIVEGDVRNASTIESAASAAEHLGSLDGVVYNAGVLDPVSKVANADANAWKELFDINLFSIVASLPVWLPMLRSSKGRIIMISSGAAVSSYQGWSAYGCSKAAMNHLAQDLGVEEPDVTTVAVRPGVIDTDMQKSIREQHGSVMNPDNHAKFTSLKADGGLVEPETVSKVIAQMSLSLPHDQSGKFIQWSDFKTS